MLPKEFRLKKRSAFTATYKTGKCFHSSGITLFIGKEKKTDYTTKVGFVVSKKIHKRAVKRNRIKRLMRESVRLYIKKHNDLEIKYISLIFTASSSILTKNFDNINETIINMLDKLK